MLSPIVRFPLQPRIRRRFLATAVLEHARPPDASDIAQRAFVFAVLATTVVIGVKIVPEMVSLIASIPDAVALLSGGTLTQ